VLKIQAIEARQAYFSPVSQDIEDPEPASLLGGLVPVKKARAYGRVAAVSMNHTTTSHQNLQRPYLCSKIKERKHRKTFKNGWNTQLSFNIQDVIVLVEPEDR